MTKILDYPLRFTPIYVEKVWGGNRLNTVLHKNSPYKETGESWEISAVEENTTVIENGPFAGEDLRAICDKYPIQLMGKRITERFGGKFPLLVKFLDAHIPLSVQVHPDDAIAQAYNSTGKNEMWYILDAEPEAKIYLGFSENEKRETIAQAIKENALIQKIKQYHPKHGDVFHVPAREVHAIGADVLLAEIQQTSDITFRLYDWNRKDENGEERELHIAESLDTLNYKASKNLYFPKDQQQSGELVHNKYFKTNIIQLDDSVNRNTRKFDSFIIYMMVKGEAMFKVNNYTYPLRKGETFLMPYELGALKIEGNHAELLEIYI